MTDIVDNWIAGVRVKSNSRTRYEGQPPYADESVADEIERLRAALGQACRRGCDYCADDVRNARAALNTEGEASGKWLRVPADDDVETVLADQIGRLPDAAVARLIRGALGRDGVVEDLATRFRSDDWLGGEVASSIRKVIRWTILEEKPHD